MSLTLARTYSSTSNTSSYTTTVFTPAANDLLIVFAVATGTTAAGGCTSSAGLTFTQVRVAHKAAGADTLYAYVADQLATAVSQTVTVTTTGDPASGCAIMVVAVSGMPLAGLSAIRQSWYQDNGAAGGTPAPVFQTLPDTANTCLGFLANGRNPALMSPPAGWTEPYLGDIGFPNPATGAEVCWAESGVVGTTVTWATSSATAFGAIIIELSGGHQAGIATATGTAHQAGVYAIPMSIMPGLGTGTAYNVTATTSAPPVSWNAWSQTWSNTVGTAVYAYPEVAEGFGAAPQPASRPAAGLAEGTGTAYDALASGRAGVAEGSGAAADVTADVAPNALLPDVAGTAYDVTAKIAGKKYVDAGLAQGTATVPAAGTSLDANAEAATGTGSAESPAASHGANAGVAEGTGSASPVTAPGQAVAGVAEGTGTAYPLAAQYAQAGLATADGAAYDLVAGGEATTDAATGTGAAGDPTVSVKASAGVAAGTGEASGIAAPNVATAGHATGSGTAYGVVQAATSGTPPVAVASHAMPSGIASHHVPVAVASHPTPKE